LKNNFVNDLQSGMDLIDEPLLLKDLIRRTTKDNRPYMLCTMGDKTGQISGVFWDLPAQIDGWLKSGLVVFVTGRVSSYKDSLQINISDIYPMENPNLADYLPSSTRTQEEMVNELVEIIGSLAEPWQSFLEKVLLDDAFLPNYSASPAAKVMHHAAVGGLLDHSLSMAKIAQNLADHYPHVNKDLLVAGALVHDMGKVWEYSFQGSFDVSEDGRLIGHITRAAIELERHAMSVPEIQGEPLQELLHLVVSHHGTMEWGSPSTPKTLEAVLLHQIDLLDSRVQGYFDYLADEVNDSGWSNKRSPMHGTFLRRPPTWKS